MSLLRATFLAAEPTMFHTSRRSPAEQLATEMRAAHDHELRVTVRELCARFGVTRPTPVSRLDVTRLLAAHGVVVDPPLAGDDAAVAPPRTVTLRPRGREAVTDVVVPFGPPRPEPAEAPVPTRGAARPARTRSSGRRLRLRLPHRVARTRHE